MNDCLQKRSFFFFVLSTFICLFSFGQTMQPLAPVVWKVVYGQPEKFLPSDFKEAPLLDGLQQLPAVHEPPYKATAIRFRRRMGGF
jgi:alpha-D-xyloside xylohydrolase